MAVTKRFYVADATVPYSPATFRGAWDATAGTVDKLLSDRPAGAAAQVGIAETNATANWDVMLGRWVSNAIGVDYTFTVSDTVEWVIGAREGNALQDSLLHVHIYVTTGDSDTVRGTLLTDFIGATELPTTAAGDGDGAQTLAGTVAALAGDRVVVEIGYRNQEASATSRISTINYGNTGTTDLTDANTNVTTRPGWVQFVTATMVFPEVVTASGTWTCPTGIDEIKVQAWGGGGGGSTYTTPIVAGGGAGGGGAYSLKSGIAVTPATGYTATVGTGGTAGNNGNDSGFADNSQILAKGGTGVANNTSAGGAGGTTAASVGDTKYAGGNGGNGGASSSVIASGGGGGGAGTTGAGGNGGNGSVGTPGTAGTGTALFGGTGGVGVYNAGGNVNGNPGTGIGSGGSGSYRYITGSPTGGTGANGLLIITPTSLDTGGGGTAIKDLISSGFIAFVR